LSLSASQSGAEETDAISGGSAIKSEGLNWLNFVFISQQIGG
jgi:hypothetical protein